MSPPADAGETVDHARTAKGGGRVGRRGIIGELARRARTGTQFALSHLARRDKRIWVFGNHKGFRDNPRYLAEHVVATDPRVETWWIARTQREADMATGAGLRVAMRGSDAAARVQRHAGVAFLTNGFEDLEARHLGGAYVVDLRHGKGLKKVLLDMDGPREGSMAARMSRALTRWFAARRLAQIDMIVAPGEMAKGYYESAFRGGSERIRVLGTPRFDVIQGGPAYERVAGPDPRGRLGLSDDAYVVLWLPTWREEGDAAWLPVLDMALLERQLEGTSAVIALKPHPFSDVDVYRDRLPRTDRLVILPEADVDANALLRLGDALITDYSSVAFDFALLDRPIHFFVPDLDAYRGGAGLYEPFENLSEGQHHLDWASLLVAVRRATMGDDAAPRELARHVRARGRNNDAPGSCERIRLAVSKAVGLEPASAAQT